MQRSPLHLYVHIPFCLHKCHYCDFNSHERKEPPWREYQEALTNELAQHAESPVFAGRRLETIFFGGGTPSLAPPSLVDAVIDNACQLFGMDARAEISLEANPGTADAENFLGYRQAGVNRLSIGVQSMNSVELRWLERIHNREQALQAYRLARHVGFNNINLDLIYGLPGQKIIDWMESLEEAIRLEPEHISCYQLTIEPHTKLSARHSRKPYQLPDDDLALSLFNDTRTRLLDAGYRAYEVSNFAKPGKECRHNDSYWLYDDYIGIGAGAAGKWDQSNGGVRRYTNIRSPERYIEIAEKGSPVIHTQEELDVHKAAAEALWLGLRRREGIVRSLYRQRFDCDAWEQFPSLRIWHKRGKLAVTDEAIRLTAAGLPLADAIAASVL